MTQARTILIIDDDKALRQSLAEQLGDGEGFTVRQAGTGAEGLAAAHTPGVDLIILDLGLPDMDGREVCKALRRAGISAPVIMLTGHDSDDDAITGLDAGANDYVVKPMRFGVLLARIRAQLRQHETNEEAVFQVGPYLFRPAQKSLTGDQGAKIRLTEKEAAILKFLYRAGASVVSRDTLLHEVWGYNSGVTTHTLETHIYRLRQKIEPDPAGQRLIVTDAGGYRLMA